MAHTQQKPQLASVTARDGVDTRNKDNLGKAAASTEETTRLGAGDQVRGGQTAVQNIGACRECGTHGPRRKQENICEKCWDDILDELDQYEQYR